MEPPTQEGLTSLLATLELEVAAPTLLDALLAWTQLFGLISFELFGQTRGLVEDHEAFLRDSAGEMAVRIGL